MFIVFSTHFHSFQCVVIKEVHIYKWRCLRANEWNGSTVVFLIALHTNYIVCVRVCKPPSSQCSLVFVTSKMPSTHFAIKESDLPEENFRQNLAWKLLEHKKQFAGSSKDVYILAYKQFSYKITSHMRITLISFLLLGPH